MDHSTSILSCFAQTLKSVNLRLPVIALPFGTPLHRYQGVVETIQGLCFAAFERKFRASIQICPLALDGRVEGFGEWVVHDADYRFAIHCKT
jgi:hypothetical protein